jgi:hypothetical protein
VHIRQDGDPVIAMGSVDGIFQLLFFLKTTFNDD